MPLLRLSVLTGDVEMVVAAPCGVKAGAFVRRCFLKAPMTGHAGVPSGCSLAVALALVSLSLDQLFIVTTVVIINIVSYLNSLSLSFLTF